MLKILPGTGTWCRGGCWQATSGTGRRRAVDRMRPDVLHQGGVQFGSLQGHPEVFTFDLALSSDLPLTFVPSEAGTGRVRWCWREACRMAGSSSLQPDARSVHATLLLDADQGTDQGMSRVRRVRPIRNREAVPTIRLAREWVVGLESGRSRLVRPSVVVSQSSEVETCVQRN